MIYVLMQSNYKVGRQCLEVPEQPTSKMRTTTIGAVSNILQVFGINLTQGAVIEHLPQCASQVITILMPHSLWRKVIVIMHCV